MTTLAQLCARLAAATALSTVAVVTAGTTALADPPPGWSGGTEANFGSVRWVHEGRHAGSPGNWHVGELTIEEDDDILTGSVIDWWCPQGVEPPGPLVWPLPPTACKVKDTTYISQLDPWDIADFDHATNRLTLSGSFDEVDDMHEVIGSVPINLTIKGLGDPTVGEWLYADGTMLDYEESFASVKAWGRVDGHRVSGPRVTQHQTSLSFYIYGLTRSP